LDRHGKELSKTAKKGEIKIGENNLTNKGRGRPKGSLNKTTLALREMILRCLDRVGGEIENSSAYCSGRCCQRCSRPILAVALHRSRSRLQLPNMLPSQSDPTDDTNEGAV
jgi:hypothetical protein